MCGYYLHLHLHLHLICDKFGHFQAVMPLVLKELLSSVATNRRNAAFCVGELCKNGGDSVLKYSSNY